MVLSSNPTCRKSGKNVTVKCTLVQALRLSTGRTAYRGSRGIALLFLDHGTRRVGGQSHAPAALYPLERSGTYCTEGWVGPRAGLDGWKISPPPGFAPRTIQPVPSRYTDYATRPTGSLVLRRKPQSMFCASVRPCLS